MKKFTGLEENEYIVGVSSGMFMTASQEEKPQFATIARKIFRGGLDGTDFTQVDIESITEFKEPFLDDEIEKMEKMKIRFGVHGESGAMGGGEKPIGMLDSAIETHYQHAHDRLLKHIKGCGKIKAEFVNIHPSETTHFFKLPLSLQPSKLVDPWGRSIKKFLDENPDILNWSFEKEQSYIWEFSRRDPTKMIKDAEDEEIKRRTSYNADGKIREPSSEEKARIRKEVEKYFKRYFVDLMSSSELSYGAERAAYYMVAKWMMNKKDSLWKKIVDSNKKKIKITDKDFSSVDKQEYWVPAVAAKYIEGHFRPRDSQYENPLPLLEEYHLYFVFEAQMGSAGLEGLHRIVKPVHMMQLCSTIGSEWVGVTIDIEHVLSQNLNPLEEADEIPNGLAKYLIVMHIGFPTPHIPAHLPLELGSREQEYVYKLAHKLKKKGFSKGYLIFERGASGRGTSILSIRKIQQHLIKDIEPKDLKEDFYGLRNDDYQIKKQEVMIKEHALDPLKGLLRVPEEDFTFLSTEAVRQGKGEAWAKRRYR